jgi:type VI secretion system secreted protein VgrG
MALPYIKVGDDLIQDAVLASVEIVQELNQHWWCTVVCRQTQDKRIPVENFLGQQVEVQTIDDQGVVHVNFTGFVLDVELTYEVWGSYAAQITCVSETYKMDITARKEYYTAQTLEQVAQTTAANAGLSATVSGPSQKALNYVQYGETDFSFVNRIVDDYACWLRPSETGIEIFNAFQSGTAVEFRGEESLLDFKIKGVLAPSTFNGSHYDYHSMSSNTFQQVSSSPQFYPSSQRLVGAVQSQSASLFPSGFASQRARAMTLGDYQEGLQRESQRSIGGSITAYGHSRSQQLKAGDTVEIQGLLDAKGTYGLVKVVHKWERSGYTNSFLCTPWKDYRNPEQPRLRAWYGTVSARVVEHDDPKKMGRVKVQFFWQSTGSTHWARTVSPHAGPDRGFMFMPEVGDEVAVVFEDGDPERPVILGSLWNGVQNAPRGEFFGEDIAPNNVKRIVTKAGNRLQMIDTPGKETLVFATPNHSSISLTEKSDGTGRTLVTVQSDGDIVLSAPQGRVHIRSKFFSREVG